MRGEIKCDKTPCPVSQTFTLFEEKGRIIEAAARWMSVMNDPPGEGVLLLAFHSIQSDPIPNPL